MSNAKPFVNNVKSAEPIIKRVNSGKTMNVTKPMQAPDSLVKGSSNMGGTAPSSRVYGEMK